MSHFFIPQNMAGIVLPEGSSFILKDFRGFTVFEIKENGDFYHKGRQVKMQ